MRVEIKRDYTFLPEVLVQEGICATEAGAVDFIRRHKFEQITLSGNKIPFNPYQRLMKGEILIIKKA